MKKILILSALIALATAGALADTPGVINFPGSLDSRITLLNAADNAATTLTSTAGATDTTLSVASTALFPSSGAVTIDSEIIYYTSIGSSTTITGCIRGSAGTTAATHLSGRPVQARNTAAHHNLHTDAIVAVEAKVGTGSSAPANGYFLSGSGVGTSAWRLLLASDIPAIAESGVTNLTSDLAAKVSLQGSTPGTQQTGNINVSGTVIAGAFSGNASTASALAADPADCSANQFATAISASGALTCAQVAGAQLSLSDVTTNDVTTTAHGFAPKAPNDTTKFLRGDGTWAAPAGGGSPAGSGSELQARSGPTTFQAVTGSSTASGGIALVNQSAAAVPFSVTGAASQSANLINVTSNGGTTGDLLKLTSGGVLTAHQFNILEGSGASAGISINASPNYGMFYFNNAIAFEGGGTSTFNINIIDNLGVAVGSGSVYGFKSTADANIGTYSASLSMVSAGVVGIGTGAPGTVDGTVRSTYYETVVGSAVASATTITPTGGIFHVTGTTAIATINLPRTGFTGCIQVIPNAAFTTTTAGNIALASTAVANKLLQFCYDGTKWYPSY